MKKIELDKLDRNTPILLFQAHCDDESFLCAGFINKLVSNGYRVILIYFASAIVVDELKTNLRQRELLDACKILGVKDIRFLDFCEPKYDPNKSKPLFLQKSEDVLQNLVENIQDVLKKPFNIISYDENGGYGNKDHIIVHKVGRMLLAQYSDKINHFYEVTINRDLYLNWTNENKNKVDENMLPKLQYWSSGFGLSENVITDYYELNTEEIIVKKNALIVHASQIKSYEFPLTLSDDFFKDLFGKEYFLKIK